MDEHSQKILEYRSLTEMLAGHAQSAPGVRVCLGLKPDLSPTQAQDSWLLVEEAKELIGQAGRCALEGLPEASDTLERLDTEGLTLSPVELLLIAQTAQTAYSAARYFRANAEIAPRLAGFAAKLPDLGELGRALELCLGPEGEIIDTASPALGRLRREMTSLRAGLRQKLESMIRDEELRPALQEDFITQRGDRYVIPVKTSHGHRVPGLVHDSSKSGATLYVEPLEVLKENNRLNLLRGEIKREEERILARLSLLAASHKDNISTVLSLLAWLDSVFAKASLAMKLKARAPMFDKTGGLKLKQARHPFLVAKERAGILKTVPIDIKLTPDERVLIISGVNAGGKTASLKTAGLLMLMAQAGLQIPVAEGSSIPFFTDILALVGDEQDLKSELSTFSGHVKRLAAILEKAEEGCLVLLDELGTGTDPAEGAALAIAILDELKSRQAWVMTATHYHLLKAYAYQTPGVVNAAVETDTEGRPVYGISYGAPGFSGGLSMAAKMGLAPQLVQKAVALLDDGQKKSRELMEGLEAERAELARLRAAQEGLNKALEEDRRRLSQKELENENQRQKEVVSLKKDAAQVIETAQKAFDQAIKKALDGDKKEAGRAIHDFHNAKQGLRKALNTIPQPRPLLQAENLAVGSPVMVRSLKARGHVFRLWEDLGRVEVEIGGLKIKTVLSDLARPSTTTAPEEQPNKRPFHFIRQETGPASKEINLIGLSVDEALPEVDKLIDRAVTGGLKSVAIIHGKGTGRLREAVRTFVETDSRVKKFASGGNHGGGEGVTEVELY